MTEPGRVEPSRTNEVDVRGPATSEELAAIVAALGRHRRTESPYERWRRRRLAALKATGN